MITVEKWRRHRRLITPAFNANILKQFTPLLNQKNEILIKNLRKKLNETKVFDLWDCIAPLSLDSICGKFIILS